MATLTNLTPEVSLDRPVALVLPGVGYTVQAPLLYWSIGILLADGWRVITVDWTIPGIWLTPLLNRDSVAE